MPKQPAERKPRDNSIFAVMTPDGEIQRLIEAPSVAAARKHIFKPMMDNLEFTKPSALTIARLSGKIKVEKAGE